MSGRDYRSQENIPVTSAPLLGSHLLLLPQALGTEEIEQKWAQEPSEETLTQRLGFWGCTADSRSSLPVGTLGLRYAKDSLEFRGS